VPCFFQEFFSFSFCCVVQLETDQELLLLKARAARERYGVHAVVANELPDAGPQGRAVE